MSKRCVAWTMLVLAACGSHGGSGTRAGETAPTPGSAAVPSTPTSTTPTNQTPTVSTAAGRTRKIEAPHGGAITALAVTPDATAVVSVDELGGARLWPALDGSIEPRVVDLPAPRQLAITRDPKGFLIAMLDEVGYLVLTVVDQDGVRLSRATPPADPAYKGLAMTPTGPIAWRADQILFRYNADGTVAEQLGTEAGQRILAITVAGDKAIAVIESGADKLTRRARWLALGPKLAWGAWLKLGDDVSTLLAVSPSGKRVATVAGSVPGTQALLSVFDTATGTPIATQVDQTPVGLGFVDDDHLALVANGAISWAKLDLKAPVQRPRPNPDAPPANLADGGMLGVVAGRAISALNGELMIATPTKIEYLGYELESPAVAAVAPKGQLVIGVGDSFALLDQDLRAVATPSLGVLPTSAVSELRWLGGDDWLVESSRISDGITTLALVDAAKGKTSVLRADLAMVQLILHEPSTNLVTLSLGDAPEVNKYDPAKHKLEKLASLPKPKGYEQSELVPVNPELAGGTNLVVVHMRDRMTIRWLKDPKVLDKGASITVDGSLAGVDAAGRVYVWQNTPTGPLELVSYVEGKRVGTLPTDGPVTLWPDRKGARVVQVGQRSVGLSGADGSRVWLQALQFVTEALWLDDGSIVVVSAGGLARLDAATGTVLAARCGWRFGLSAKQHPASARVEPICTVR